VNSCYTAITATAHGRYELAGLVRELATIALFSLDMAGEDEIGVQGRVERVRDGVVEGWAWNSGAPDRRLELRVSLDGQEVGATVAELPRPSLAAAGIGDGVHAFRFVLPATLAGPGQHSLRIDSGGEALPAAVGFVVESVLDDGGWNGAQFTVESPEPHESAVSADEDNLTIEGRVEQVRNGIVDGWAWHPSAAAERVQLRVLLDDEDVGEAIAELPRPSLAAAGIGDGEHAFRFVLPAAIATPGQHTLRVQANGTALPAAGGFVVRADDGDPWYAARFTVQLGDEPDETSKPAAPALVGLDGWLFDGAAAPAWSEGYAVSQSNVSSLLEVLGQIEQRVAEAGVKLLVVLNPAKEHIYRDRLPREVREAIAQRPADVVIRGMMAHPVLDPLDLLPALQVGAEQHPVSMPTAPLLSDWGSYCAYRAIIKRVAMIVPGVPPPVELAGSDVRTVASRRWNGPAVLATESGLVSCAPEALPEPPLVPVVVLPPGSAVRTPHEHLARIGSDFVVGWEQPDREQLARVLFVGHPAFEPVADWAARHFRFTLLVGTDSQVIDLVSLERPDVVIYLVDEASLLGRP